MWKNKATGNRLEMLNRQEGGEYRNRKTHKVRPASSDSLHGNNFHDFQYTWSYYNEIHSAAF